MHACHAAGQVRSPSRTSLLGEVFRGFSSSVRQMLGNVRPGADLCSKAAFGKSAFAKTNFLLLKIRLAHTNLAKSKNAFEHVLTHLSRKHFARCTCQYVLESAFSLCSIGVRQSYL